MEIDLITADPDENSPDTIAVEIDLFVQQLKGSIPQYNAQFAAVNAAALTAVSAVAALPAAKWVAGTYSDGDVRWSPTDYQDYRNKGSGTRNTDPALDPTNWVPRIRTGNGGADTTSSAVDIALTFTSGRLQIVSMTAAGKKLTIPPANTLTKGALVFVVKNAGVYRFSVHKDTGGFLCYVQPGQVIAFHCSDIGSLDGEWQISGQGIEQIYSGNTAEVLNAVDSRFISAAMLTSTKAICAFIDNVTGYPNAVVLNYGSASGSPAQITAEAGQDVSIAAQMSNQATVVYKTSTGVTKAVVLDITTNTFTAGTVKQIDAGTTGRGTTVTALSTTQLAAGYYGTSAGTPRIRVLDIASSVITESAEVVADSTAGSGLYLSVRKVSATKVLFAFRDNANKRLQLRLQSISGSTPAPTGSVLDLTSIFPGTSQNLQFGPVVLSANRAVVFSAADRTYSDFIVALIDISGTTPVLLRSRVINVGVTITVHATATKLDENSLFVAWNGGYSPGIDGVRIAITADDNILIGQISENLEQGVTVSGGYVACAALDSTHVMLVDRNSATFLSAKTLEVSV